MRISVYVISLLLVSVSGFSQKIRFASSIGTSFINWHENQPTLDLWAQISFQNPGKKHLFYVKLKTLGNIEASSVDRNSYTFVEPPLMANNTISVNATNAQAFHKGTYLEGVPFSTYVQLSGNHQGKRMNKLSEMPIANPRIFFIYDYLRL